EIFIMQSDIGLTQRGTVTGVECRIPLLVLLTKAHDHKIRLFNQGTGANGIDLGRLVVTPERITIFTKVVTRSVTSWVICNRRGEGYVQACRFCTALDLFTPIRVDLTRQINIETHGQTP